MSAAASAIVETTSSERAPGLTMDRVRAMAVS
jgi:hypothetical protein